MIELLSRVMDHVQSGQVVPEKRQRHYHVCTRCGGVSVNALWRLEQFDNGLHYQCPRCDQWVAFDEYTVNRLDRRLERDGRCTRD